MLVLGLGWEGRGRIPVASVQVPAYPEFSFVVDEVASTRVELRGAARVEERWRYAVARIANVVLGRMIGMKERGGVGGGCVSV